MSILFRKCPCCGHKIPKISMLTRNMHYACAQKENYKCMHCPECHRQISKPYHLFSETISGGILLIACFAISKLIVARFVLPPKLPDGLLIIPLVLICMMIFLYFYTSIVPLQCYKVQENENEIQKANKNNVLIEGVLEFDEHVRIDPLEKKIASHMLFAPTYYFLFVVFGVLAVLIYRYFCANC